MKQIVFDTGKGLLKFKVEGTKVFITDMNIGKESVINPSTFEEQKTSQRFVMAMRRKKGEKYYNEWVNDLNKYKNFKNEEEIIQDLKKDFNEKRGHTIINEK